MIVWPLPAVPSPACDQSEETAKTYDPAVQLVSVADGSPDVELAVMMWVSVEVSAPVRTIA